MDAPDNTGQASSAVLEERYKQAAAEFKRGNFAAARQVFESLGEQLADAPGHPLRIDIENGLGSICLYHGEMDEAREHFQRCIELCSADTNAVTRIKPLCNLGLIEQRTGHLMDAHHCFTQALEVLREQESTEGQSHVLVNLGNNYRLQGNYKQALQEFQQAIELGEKPRDADVIAQARASIGGVYVDIGDWQQAQQYLEPAAEFFHSQNIPRLYASTLLNLGLAYEKQGDDRARKSYLTSLAVGREISETYISAKALKHLALLNVKKQMWVLAQEALEDMLELAVATNHRQLEGEAEMELGRLMLELGKPREAQSHLESAASVFATVNSQHYSITTDCLRGWTLVALGKRERAAQLLAIAKAQLDDVSFKHGSLLDQEIEALEQAIAQEESTPSSSSG